MFFILSKVLFYLIQPLSLVFICFIGAILLRKKTYKKRGVLAGILLLFFFSNEFIVNEVMLKWEVAPKAFNETDNNYDVGIVLSGVANLHQKPNDRVYFNKGADRVTHTIQLYKLNKIGKILISGGTGSILYPSLKEADQLKKVFIMAGVPERDIMVENQSRNTHENAVFSANILRDKFSKGKFLLITSAFHMKRAEACFVKAGINPDTFSTDFYSYERSYTPNIFLVPSELAILKWHVLEKEIVGTIMYKLAGYL